MILLVKLYVQYHRLYIYKQEAEQQYCTIEEKLILDNIEVYTIQQKEIIILLFSKENIPGNHDNCHSHNYFNEYTIVR